MAPTRTASLCETSPNNGSNHRTGDANEKGHEMVLGLVQENTAYTTRKAYGVITLSYEFGGTDCGSPIRGKMLIGLCLPRYISGAVRVVVNHRVKYTELPYVHSPQCQ